MEVGAGQRFSATYLLESFVGYKSSGLQDVGKRTYSSYCI